MFDDDRNFYQNFVDTEYREVNNNNNTFILNNSSNVDSIINGINAVFLIQINMLRMILI